MGGRFRISEGDGVVWVKSWWVRDVMGFEGGVFGMFGLILIFCSGILRKHAVFFDVNKYLSRGFFLCFYRRMTMRMIRVMMIRKAA